MSKIKEIYPFTGKCLYKGVIKDYLRIIYGLTMDSVSFVDVLSSIGIGLAVGIFVRLDETKNIKGVIGMSLVVILVSVVVSTSINMIYWAGTTGNIWGDALYA